MKRVICIVLLSLPFLGIAQDKPKDKAKPDADKKASLSFYGFVRNYFNYDSRRTMTACGGEYNMIPYDEDWNITTEEEATLIANGVTAADGTELRFDRNAAPQTHLLALSSRFGLNLNGPQLIGATSEGKFEADFAGFGTNNTILRLRLAYLRLNWGGKYGHSLTIGQDWHPLTKGNMPDVLGMAAGAPFRPHSRTPQITYDIWLPWRFGFTASALWQYQFTSPGPDGESAKYANEAILPELFLGVLYQSEHSKAMLGVDYTRLTVSRMLSVPYTIGGTSMSADVRFRGSCHSFSPTFLYEYEKDKFTLQFRSTLAENLGHLTIPGSGYALLSEGLSYQFQPFTAAISYLNLSYGKRWRTNLFIGYHKSLGLADGTLTLYAAGVPDPAYIYTKKGVNNINSIYRVAPSFSYNVKAFNIGLEYEWTAVTYGDLQPDGTVANNANLRQVSNHRICALVKYNF